MRETEEVMTTEMEENTGDAALDNPRNQDDIGERELLVVSFGTSYNDARRLSIGGIEDALAAAYPDWSVRRAFTSQIVLDHVRERDGVSMDNVGAALQRAMDNGVKELVVQPTHLMNGFEYQELAEEIGNYADAFERVTIGAPLLTSDDDFRRVAEAVLSATADYIDGETAVCLMGHGTEADSNGVYDKMQGVLSDMGARDYYVGTVEAEPSLEDVLASVQAGSYKRAVLEPLMIVAGDHANNDMAGDEPESWKSVFEGAGYETVCVLRGLGELEEIQAIFAEHVQAAMEGGGLSADAAPDASQPFYASDLNAGTYPVDVKSDSSMFRVTDCALTVSGDSMTAVMTMGGTGYLYVYPGTAAEASAAPESAYISFEENADGAHTFTVPVAALNEGVACAAYGKNSGQWYDRTLTFRADSLPPEAFAEAPDAVSLPDGDYTIEVTLGGGSGRASVESPAALTVRGGACTARIVWNSPNYDYMIVDGERYLPVNADGASAFEIPVAAFDRPLTVRADTTAMSQPHEIEYELTFLSETARAA